MLVYSLALRQLGTELGDGDEPSRRQGPKRRGRLQEARVTAVGGNPATSLSGPRTHESGRNDDTLLQIVTEKAVTHVKIPRQRVR